ncbi:IS66 family insertion sequence element accessory protein TnpB [Deferrisoma palaeochoriense]
MWQKRLESERFRWPRSEAEVLEIEPRQLMWLLSGLEIEQRGSHRRLSVSVAA